MKDEKMRGLMIEMKEKKRNIVYICMEFLLLNVSHFRC